MREQSIEIADARTARADTLKLLAADCERRTLVVRHDPQNPIYELILCHRRCVSMPSPRIKILVQAISCAYGMRPFSGDVCHHGEYIGANVWGKGFDKKTTYCPTCGHAMDGPMIDHIVVYESRDSEWNRLIRLQCELGTLGHNGENYGITFEFMRERRQT